MLRLARSASGAEVRSAYRKAGRDSPSAPGLVLNGAMSYSQYYRYKGHIKDGHRILNRDSVLAPAKVLVKDPCPLGLPDNADWSSYERQECYWELWANTHPLQTP